MPQQPVAELAEQGNVGEQPQLQDQEQDREHFAFNELIGLEGPLQVLLENAGTVLCTIW